MVWAIWPPMVPAPTTAALNTNMSRNSSFCFRSQVGGRPRLTLEARKCALERVAHRTPHEGEVDYSRNAAILLDGVLQLERHDRSSGVGLEADRLAAVDLLVLDLDRLADRASKLTTRSSTRPRPPGFESQTTTAPGSRGQPSSTRLTCPKPSTKVGQRRVSYHSSSASLVATPGSCSCVFTRPTGRTLLTP